MSFNCFQKLRRVSTPIELKKESQSWLGSLTFEADTSNAIQPFLIEFGLFGRLLYLQPLVCARLKSIVEESSCHGTNELNYSSSFTSQPSIKGLVGRLLHETLELNFLIFFDFFISMIDRFVDESFFGSLFLSSPFCLFVSGRSRDGTTCFPLPESRNRIA